MNDMDHLWSRNKLASSEEGIIGTTVTSKCHDCGYSKQLHLGIGMMYPRVSDAMKEAIAFGEYGAELKGAFEGCELPAVRPEDMVYICPSCGSWDVFRNASVYEPTDIEAAKKEQFGTKTVEEWDGIPYVTGWEIESGKYCLVSSYLPRCPECGDGMHPLPVGPEGKMDASLLKCPRCGSSNSAVDVSGFWD